jgi:hypothetical protein
MIINVFHSIVARSRPVACGLWSSAPWLRSDDDPGLQIAIVGADHIDCDSVERRDSVSKGITWTHWTWESCPDGAVHRG